MSVRPDVPVAVVTGASRGIGLACARALAPDHKLLLSARNAQKLASVAEELTGAGPGVETQVCDLLREADRKALVEAAVASGATILVNNAGIARSQPVHKTTDTDWNELVTTNLTAPFELMRALIPVMNGTGWGRVINVASTAGLKGYRYTAAYCATKHGLIGLTRGASLDLARRGVTVNAVCPGFTETDMATQAIDNIAAKTGRSADQARSELEQLNPQGRIMTPEEVAQAVVYLASDAARGVTGQAWAVDGGETA